MFLRWKNVSPLQFKVRNWLDTYELMGFNEWKISIFLYFVGLQIDTTKITEDS